MDISGVDFDALTESANCAVKAVLPTTINSDDGIAASVQLAANIIAGALNPSAYDWIALFISVIASVASVCIIFINIKTVKAAQQQVNMGLYPMRRDVLKTLDEKNYQNIRGLSSDIKMLFGIKAQNAFKEYIEIDSKYTSLVGLQKDIEQSVLDRDDSDREKQELQELNNIAPLIPSKEFLKRSATILKNTRATVLNPEKMEKENLRWSDVDLEVKECSDLRNEKLRVLKLQIINEISESLRS